MKYFRTVWMLLACQFFFAKVQSAETGGLYTHFEKILPVIEKKEFMGEVFLNSAQLNAYKLFLATLEIATNNSHRVMLVSKIRGGMGDYAYLHKVASLIKEEPSDLKVEFAIEVNQEGESELLRNAQLSGKYQQYKHHILPVFDIDAAFEKARYSSPDEGEIRLKKLRENISLMRQKSQNIQKELSQSKFSLLLATFPLAIPTNVWKSPTFYIGEILTVVENLSLCSSDRCIDRQKNWVHENHEEAVKAYSHSALGVDDYRKQAFYNKNSEEFRFVVHRDLMKKQKETMPSIDYAPTACMFLTGTGNCLNSPRFGIGVNGVGWLISEDIEKKVSEYQQAEEKYDTTLFQDLVEHATNVLGVLADSEKPEEIVNFFLGGGQYYFGYFHQMLSQLSFIHSILNAHTDENITVVMPSSRHDLESEYMQQGLRVAEVSTVMLWSKNADWEKIAVADEISGKTVRIINPFPLETKAFQAILFFSGPVVGTTGDHSFYEAISMRKLPYHEVFSHQYFFRHQLSYIADQPKIKEFYDTMDPVIKGKLMMQLENDPHEIELFVSQLRDNYNANGLIRSIIRTAANPPPAVLRLIEDTEKLALRPFAEQDDYCQSLESDYADIVRTRLIVRTLNIQKKASGYHGLFETDWQQHDSFSYLLSQQEPESINHSFKHLDKIGSGGLRALLQEAIKAHMSQYDNHGE